MKAEDYLEGLNFRYATKIFDPNKSIEDSTWSIIEKSLALTPSSFGLQPWKFYVIKDPEVRSRLKSASWGQTQVTDASHLVVFASRTDLNQSDVDKWITCLSNAQEVSVESLSAYSSMIMSFSSGMNTTEKQMWNTRQCYIALGQLMTGAAMLGIDTCPLEGISPKEYDEILQINDTGYTTVVACAIGYRSLDDKYAVKKKARFDLSEVIHYV